jgi:alpha-tubulin suppressor-like RCC1 family protein
LAFGKNIDNQLGCERHKEPQRDKFSLVAGTPFISRIEVGRNSVFTVDAETGQVFGWGSNKYGQIVPGDSLKGLLGITDLTFQLEETESLLPSSYFTLLLTRRDASSLFRSFEQESKPISEDKPSTSNSNPNLNSEYRKLL